MSSDTPFSKPVRRAKDSGELDVFEAAWYFSDGCGGVRIGDGDDRRRVLKEERKSSNSQQSQKAKDYIKNKKKSKKGNQPSSPGGKLASFLNSLFYQTASKKKSKSLAEDEGEVSQGERKIISDYKSIYCRNRNHGNQKSIDFVPQRDDDGILKDKDGDWGNEFASKERIRRGEEEESNGESDSSSDLFELKNYELADLASGLPLYGTTDREIFRLEVYLDSITP